ncbi:MAG TPA: YqgE/AlgH family protein [Rhizomicrobium sp.]|nr:YqgE/AlgH family protein [Rhizomicrobium sp.]
MQSLTGQLLIAMPQMEDPRFEHSVVYLFAHSEKDGAMGIIVNKTIGELTEEEVYEHLEIEPSVEAGRARPVHFGGPVGTELGFVLHSGDYRETGTAGLAHGFALTTSFDILRAMSKGKGPRQHILALGYAGWGPGQLEAEIQDNGWLLVEADTGLVFGPDDGSKWSQALAKLGVKPEMLAGRAGQA